jgi:hypothetical protein
MPNQPVDMDRENCRRLRLWQFPGQSPARSVYEMKRIWIPQAIAAVMLLWALNPENPYGEGSCS